MSHRLCALVVGAALAAMSGMAHAAPPAGQDDGFATRSVTGLGLTGDGPARVPAGDGGGARVGTGANAGVVGTGGGSGAVGTGAGPGTPMSGGGTFGPPARR